jgi:CubicO group peptidase (beta-lactamase class C family)
MLAEHGLIDLKSSVSSYWPDFAQQGKGSITIEQLLSHQAGIAIIDQKFSFYDILNNPEKVGELLAGQKPNWEPGQLFGYHGITMGLLMDQLIRRVDPKHRSLTTFFQEEIAEPFNIDFYIGLPKAENYRTARVFDVDLFSLDTFWARQYWNLWYAYMFDHTSLFYRSLLNPPEYMEDLHNNPYWREVPTASSTGFGTGASIAKLMGILANGGDSGDQHLLSPESIHRLGIPLVNGKDSILMRNMTFGPGTMIRRAPHGGNIFGHSGAGGQVGFADPKYKLGWSYLTNHHNIFALGDSPRVLELEAAMYECAMELEQKIDLE